MLYAIIADIHSNAPALQAVLAYIDGIKVDRIVCLGDVVGYAGHPQECIDILVQRDVEVVLGNHDAAMAGTIGWSLFNPYAARSLRWTLHRVSEESLRYFKNLPLVLQEDRDVFSHASCADPESFPYVLSREGSAGECRYLRQHALRACFIGHTHIPVVYREVRGSITRYAGEMAVLDAESVYSINVGSVGQPRDGDPRACCCIYNSGIGLVQLVRLTYDIQAAQAKIEQEGLPSFCAERLALGR